MITDIITSGAMHSIKSVFQKKKERNVIIDPFSCLVKLSLIRYLDEGTKISISQNRLNFNAPSVVQGFVRFVYGDNREDLHNILLPIQKCVEWYWNEKNNDMVYMFNNAVLGLKFLKNSYSTYATIQHTLDYYIIILMQKNNMVMSKMGINTLDIEKLTNALLEPSINTNTLENNTSANSYITNNSNNSNNTNNANNNNANTKSRMKGKTELKNEIHKEIGNEESRDLGKEQNANNPNKNMEEQKINNKEDVNIASSQVRDIHKFLFELWNEREITIVIHLYREMETKQPGTERNYIYNNIMQYCEMKENKLYKYIEQNSSIL